MFLFLTDKKINSDISYKQPCEYYCTEIGRLRHIVKKRVTGLSFTTGLVIRISHDEEEAPRSLKPSINSMSPSLVHFIGGLMGGKIYVKDLCQIVSECYTFRNSSNKNKQTTSKACVLLSDDVSSFISDKEIHIITDHYIM